MQTTVRKWLQNSKGFIRLNRSPTLKATARLSNAIRNVVLPYVFPKAITPEHVTQMQIAVFLALAGFGFDSVKALLHPGWVPIQKCGPMLFVLYALCNACVPIFAAQIRHAKNLSLRWSTILLGVSAFASGVLNWLFLEIRIHENSLIPLVFHGAFGFFAGFVLTFNFSARDIQQTWDEVAERHPSKAFDIRKELQRELQWTITSVAQAIAAFVGIFGVAMAIFVGAKVKTQWVPTDPDFNSTCIQFCVGLAISLLILYWWGVATGIDALTSVRHRWVTNPEPPSPRSRERHRYRAGGHVSPRTTASR